MSVRNRLVLVVAIFSLTFLAACGSGGSTHVTPPPTGSFSNSDLNGTYVFSVTGTDAGGFFFTAAGSVQANGSGGITGGALDLNDAGNTSVLLLNIQPSTYRITADGRGTSTLVTTSRNLGLDFVLSSGSHGLVTRFDNGGTGSGSLDLQASLSQAQIAASYAFSFSGITVSGSNTLSLGTVGAFTLDAAGNITTGVQDYNSGGFSAGLTNLVLGGFVDISTAPGTAQLVTSAGTYSFDVFVIDATHMKFIETDSLPILSGDAFTQAAIPTGPMVFTMAGVDTGNFPLVAGGFMVSDGGGNLTSASLEDINDAGTVAQVGSFSGSYTALSGGRSQLTLFGFDNGTGGLLTDPVFAAYPSTGGLQLLEIDNTGGVTAGFALAQSSTTIASGEGYGLNLSASNGSGFQEDDLAEFTNNSGSLSGLVDVNQQGQNFFGRSFSGTYTADSGNTGRATISTNTFGLVSYVVSGSTALFIETDSNQVGIGAFQLQSPPAASLAAGRLAALHAVSHPHAAKRQRKGSGKL